MAYDGWIEFNDVEMINVARTTALADAMGIDVVWTTQNEVGWITAALGGADYDVVGTAPWYDPDIPASGEFAGFLPLGITGLADSSYSADAIEYVTSGGRGAKGRNATVTLVANGVLVASTDRGAAYGKQWLDRVLRRSASNSFCAGADLRFFPYAGAEARDIRHRRNVVLSRGTSITRKRNSSCSASWSVTFSMLAGDPFTYSEPVPQVSSFTRINSATAGVIPAQGDGVMSSGRVSGITNTPCPTPDYTPFYNPNAPALVVPPSTPATLPGGWVDPYGRVFNRHWVLVNSRMGAQSALLPVITLKPSANFPGALMVRLSIWPDTHVVEDLCDPLWSAYVTYVPSDGELTIDGERRNSYVWNFGSDVVRRADAVVFDEQGGPVDWPVIEGYGDILFTVDYFVTPIAGYADTGELDVVLDLVERSE